MATYSERINHLFGNDKRAVAINLVIIANAFIWYSYAFNYLRLAIESIGDQSLTTITLHFVFLLIALVAGQIASKYVKDRFKFSLYWLASGIPLSLTPIFTGMDQIGIAVFSILSGVYFGFGIPLALANFAATTPANYRARNGGILFLIIGVGGFILSLFGTESYITASAVLSAWAALGCLILITLRKQEQQKPLQQQPMSYRQIIVSRPFVLYFVPWVLFLLVNSLAFSVIQAKLVDENVFSSDLVSNSSHIEFVLAGLSAAILGFTADSKGRKRIAVAGFALLGLGYAILGFSFGNLTGWWVYTFIDGIAWGAFAMLFVFTIWGDLAENRKSEKLYVLGLIPYLLSSFVRYTVGSSVADAIGDFGVIFSFFSFFLFIAVMPLVLAPETMSEATLKSNELKNYVEKAKKQVMKTQNKKDEQQPKQEAAYAQENQAPPDESDEYKKAQELAEKYY
jgi:hypothetical protein